jgi:hypothetical protein
MMILFINKPQSFASYRNNCKRSPGTIGSYPDSILPRPCLTVIKRLLQRTITPFLIGLILGRESIKSPHTKSSSPPIFIRFVGHNDLMGIMCGPIQRRVGNKGIGEQSLPIFKAIKIKVAKSKPIPVVSNSIRISLRTAPGTSCTPSLQITSKVRFAGDFIRNTRRRECTE